MAFMADLDGEKYAPFQPDPEYAKIVAQECLQEMKETEEALWRVDRHEARPIDLKDKELLVKQKCTRAAQRLRAQESNETR